MVRASVNNEFSSHAFAQKNVIAFQSTVHINKNETMMARAILIRNILDWGIKNKQTKKMIYISHVHEVNR